MSGPTFCVSVSTRTKAPSGRSGGSAGSTALYISRLGPYAQPGEVLHLQSGNMPSWASQGRTAAARRASLPYWRAADTFERRNGRLARVLIIALPAVLTVSTQIELIRTIVQRLSEGIDGGRLPWTFALHAGRDAEGHSKNPHCHVMLSERVNDGIERSPDLWFRRAAVRSKEGRVDPVMGGARKTTALNPRAWLLMARALIAQLINVALRVAGFALRVDHRSNAARGLNRQPQPKLGPWAAWLEKRGIRTAKGDAVLKVMRSWTGEGLPTGPILAARPELGERASIRHQLRTMAPSTAPITEMSDSDSTFSQVPGFADIAPRPMPVLRRDESPRLQPSPVVGANHMARALAHSELHQVPRGWSLIIFPITPCEDAGTVSRGLLEPAYVHLVRQLLGPVLRIDLIKDSVGLCRVLTFPGGVSIKDYGDRVEVSSPVSVQIPAALANFLVGIRGWPAVQLIGSTGDALERLATMLRHEQVSVYICREALGELDAPDLRLGAKPRYAPVAAQDLSAPAHQGLGDAYKDFNSQLPDLNPDELSGVGDELSEPGI